MHHFVQKSEALHKIFNVTVQVILCETEGLEDIVPGVGRMVAVRTSNSKSSESGTDALREIRFLAGLNDPNVVRVLGVCTAEQPPWTVLEYPDMGDLAHYLQYTVPVTASVRPAANLQPVRYGQFLNSVFSKLY
jgi:Serine/threonine protein kinase